MPRSQRFIPENKDGVLVEVTGRTIGARALLVPSPNPRRFNEVIIGVMGRALEVAADLVGLDQEEVHRHLAAPPLVEVDRLIAHVE